MYDDTSIAKITSDITPPETLYAGTVATYKHPRYFTISPNPNEFDNIDQLLDCWRDLIRKALFKTCNDYVYTIELAGMIRPHFHGVCDVKDYIGITKKIL